MHKIDELKENINDLRLMFQRYQSNVDMTLNNIMGSLHNTTPIHPLSSQHNTADNTTDNTTDNTHINGSMNTNKCVEENVGVPTNNDIQITEKLLVANDNTNYTDDSKLQQHNAFEIDDYNDEDFVEMIDDLDLEVSEEDLYFGGNNVKSVVVGSVPHNDIELSELSDIDMEMEGNGVEEDDQHHIKKLELSDEDFSKIEKLAQLANNNPMDIDNISNLDVGSIMMDDGEELVFDDIDMATSIEALDNINNKSEVSIDDMELLVDNKAVEEELHVEDQFAEDLANEKVVETDENAELPTDTIMMENIVKTTEKKKNSKGGRGRGSGVKKS